MLYEVSGLIIPILVNSNKNGFGLSELHPVINDTKARQTIIPITTCMNFIFILY